LSFSLELLDADLRPYNLLLTVIRRLSQTKKAFSTLAALIHIHLISHLDLYWVVTQGRRVYAKRTTIESFISGKYLSPLFLHFVTTIILSDLVTKKLFFAAKASTNLQKRLDFSDFIVSHFAKSFCEHM
jgi:hypothetical protein